MVYSSTFASGPARDKFSLIPEPRFQLPPGQGQHPSSFGRRRTILPDETNVKRIVFVADLVTTNSFGRSCQPGLSGLSTAGTGEFAVQGSFIDPELFGKAPRVNWRSGPDFKGGGPAATRWSRHHAQRAPG